MNKIIITFFFLLASFHLTSQKDHKKMAWYRYEQQQKYSKKELKKMEKGLRFEFNQYDTTLIDIPSFVKFNSSNDSLKAFRGLLINNSGKTVQVTTQDGSLLMIMEARDSSNQWRPIEFWMWSDCGNSYMTPLKLENGYYIEFNVPIYKGEILTEMRLKLIGPEGLMYSTAFWGHVSKKQLYEKIDKDKKYFWNEDIYLEHFKN